MTDQERLRECFTALGIEMATKRPWSDPVEPNEIVIIGGGYIDFYHCFEFDAAGKLVKHGSWE